jgi:hypothetical protein
VVSRGRHPEKEIARVLAELPEHFKVNELHKSHRWGTVVCTVCGRSTPIWSTPKVPENNAEEIRKFAKRHREHP